MDVRVISLTRSTDRRAAIARNLGAVGVAFQFFDALDGTPGKGDEPDHEGLKKLSGRQLAFGEVGCYRSHLALWRLCAASGRPMVVFEDDVEVKADLADIIAWLPDQLARYGYIRLAAHHGVRSRDLGDAPGGRRLVRLSKGPFGVYGYALSPAGAQRLVDGCSRIVRSIDEAVDRFWSHGVLPYAVIPYPAWESPAQPSIIDAEIVRKGWRPASRWERLRLRTRRHGDSIVRRIFNWRVPG